MSHSTESTDETSQAGGPTTNIRLYLRASNLPKSITQQQPDTLARISVLPPQPYGSEPQLPPPVPPPGESGGDGVAEGVVDETEVVEKSSSPKWTASFSLQYELGSEMLVFVDTFAVRTSTNSVIRSSIGNAVSERGMKHLGRAVFDVQDVLGSPNNIKARRLRKGGVVYAHVEQLSSSDRPLSRPLLGLSFDSCRFNLRLRADSLVHTHSIQNRVAPTTIPNPDTYIEISRPSSSSSSSWIVVYRSPSVKESVSPTWDEAMIELGSFYSASSPGSPLPASPQDLSAFPLMITVFKVKRKKCKEIGSCQTTVANLLEACDNMAKLTGFENYGDEEGEDRKVFQLRPTAKGGDHPSGEITGLLSVVNATIENAEEVKMRSQRFLTVVDDEDNPDEKSAWSDEDTSEKKVNEMPSSHPRPKFSDYVKAGILDIDFCVAIDFTSSNGDPRRPGTQHFSRDGMMNDYEEAIEAIGSTIEKYSSSQEYPVWGFGAKYGGKVRHIFQCDPNSATAIGTQGVLNAYRTVFETDFIMSGPTEINSVLRAAANRSKKYYNAPPSESNMKYCVLLILTDGIVHDLQSTKELVQKYREFQIPLSVIVVGIGRADFKEFHQWNHAPLDVRGQFKFVEFRQHQFDPDTLSREALLNVPHETVDYFLARNILPN